MIFMEDKQPKMTQTIDQGTQQYEENLWVCPNSMRCI